MNKAASKELPGHARHVAETQPALWEAYQKLGEACAEAGPLSGASAQQVKLAMAIGAGLEGAVHSHVRRALAEGVEPDALRHIAYLAVTTLGFPRAVAALSWVEDVISKSGGS